MEQRHIQQQLDEFLRHVYDELKPLQYIDINEYEDYELTKFSLDYKVRLTVPLMSPIDYVRLYFYDLLKKEIKKGASEDDDSLNLQIAKNWDGLAPGHWNKVREAILKLELKWVQLLHNGELGKDERQAEIDMSEFLQYVADKLKS